MRRTLPLLLALGGLIALLAVACEPDPLCLEDRQCPERTTCFAGECVTREVSGDPRALYAREFRLRLEVDCAPCHHDGYEGAGVTAGDGRWRLHRGTYLDGAREQASWDDLQDFVGGQSAEATPLVIFGRGAANHPVIWSADGGRPAEQRVLEWLWLFDGRGVRPDMAPEPDMAPPVDQGPRPDGAPPVPDQGPPPDMAPVGQPPNPQVYAAEIHPRIEASCGVGCHLGNPIPGDGFFRIGPGTVPAAVTASYDDIQEFLDLANPANSKVLTAATATSPHPGGMVWAVGDANYEALRRWIAGE